MVNVREETTSQLAEKARAIDSALQSLETAQKSESYDLFQKLCLGKIAGIEKSMNDTLDINLLSRLQGRKEGFEMAMALIELKMEDLKSRKESIEEKMERPEEEDPLAGH